MLGEVKMSIVDSGCYEKNVQSAVSGFDIIFDVNGNLWKKSTDFILKSLLKRRTDDFYSFINSGKLFLPLAPPIATGCYRIGRKIVMPC